MVNKKVVLLACNGFSTNVLYNYIAQSMEIDTVIIENKIDKKALIRKRLKKLGFLKVVGQILFQGIIVSILDILSQKRKTEIIKQFQLTETPIPSLKIKKVFSVNSGHTIQLLQQLNPNLIIVNGTRIISKKVLTSVNCKFINIHAGITPKYRGVHGAYWALANNDDLNSGVTIHLVDAGIDTGGILYQQRIKISEKDNFTTYPLLQLAKGLPLLINAMKDVLGNNIKVMTGTLESHLWYHPTIWQYLYIWLVKKVK